MSRAEADWLVGINGSRVLTLTEAKNTLTPVGRVQTPTLAMIVGRDNEIINFKPKDFWIVKATFGAVAGQYIGTWFDPKFVGEGRPDQIWQKEKADLIATRCKGKKGTVVDQTKPVSRNCPPLYDLTTLQREANKKLGFSAAHTLKTAQELYENYKVLTYPRTDCRVLPDDYVAVAEKTMQMLATDFLPVQGYAKKVVDSHWIKPDKRIFNSAKVSDHFAIIPTITPEVNLPQDAAALYKMVAQRFVAVFFPAAEYLDTERITTVEIDLFKSRGRVVVDPGWTMVYGAESLDDEKEPSPALTPVTPAEKPPVVSIDVAADKTKPPPHYTEATLLSAMEGAGKIIEDDELKEAMSERGLGTPATRASIIESLLSSDYIKRNKKDLWASQKGFDLIKRLNTLTLEHLCSPQLTGEWEFKLRQIEAGKISRPVFMQDIATNVVLMVTKVKGASPMLQPSKDFACPTCKKPLVAPASDSLMCPDKHVMFRKTVAKRPLSEAEIKTLLVAGKVGPLDGFVSKEGKSFKASLKFDEKGQLAFDFGPVEVPSAFEAHDGWKIGVCESVYVAEKGKHKIYVRRKLCLREITLAETKELLSKGKLGPLDNFTSKAGKPFSASLVIKADKVEFSFEK
jgi:DNA topoisomerase-3